MTGKIISIVNRKGGVGKTTLTVCLVEALLDSLDPRERKEAAIVVDMDPQGSLTTALFNVPDPSLRLEQLKAMSAQRRTVHHLIEDRLRGRAQNLNDVRYISRGLTDLYYSLIGNDSDAWSAERQFLRNGFSEQDVHQAIGALFTDLKKQYRYVIVDCPPGQTLLAEGAVLASDLLLCPLTPDWLAFWGMEEFERHMLSLFEGRESRPKAFWAVTRFNARAGAKNPHTLILQALEKRGDPSIDFLREAGSADPIQRRINLPEDAKISMRLNGASAPNKPWTFAKAYESKTIEAVRRLARAVRKELDDG